MIRSWRCSALTALVVGSLALVLTGCPGPGGGGIPPENIPSVSRPEFGPGNYLFCFWNVENLFDDQDDGRHIATAILQRLPVEGSRTQLLEKRHRILEGHVKVAGQPLVIIAAHWTSRLGADKGVEGRAKYGNQIYGRFKGMYIANPKID